MTKTYAAKKEIAKIVTFERERLENPVVSHGFLATIEHCKYDDVYYCNVENWGSFDQYEYDPTDGDREHAIASLRELAACMGLRVIGGIE